MRLQTIVSTVIAVGLVGLFVGCASEKGKKESQAQLAAEAKISKADAQATALAKVPGGTIKEGELERENGKLQWSFDVATPGTKDITEVNIDAITGAVLGVDKESAAVESKEAKAEAKEKKQGKDDDEKEGK
jgi:hypothetical protein